MAKAKIVTDSEQERLAGTNPVTPVRRQIDTPTNLWGLAFRKDFRAFPGGVQRLRIHVSTARGMGLISGQGSNIPNVQCGQKEKTSTLIFSAYNVLILRFCVNVGYIVFFFSGEVQNNTLL